MREPCTRIAPLTSASTMAWGASARSASVAGAREPASADPD
jgi:hypothetical protein